MSDIAKCCGLTDGENVCPLKDTCRRFTAPADDLWQAWMQPDIDHIGRCKSYIKDYGETEDKRRTKRSS